MNFRAVLLLAFFGTFWVNTTAQDGLSPTTTVATATATTTTITTTITNIITITTTTNAGYYFLNYGHCPTGMHITSISECREAARLLSLPSIHPEYKMHGCSSLPPNCYTTITSGLWFSNCDYGNCSPSNRCLCRGPRPRVITTTTTTNGHPPTTAATTTVATTTTTTTNGIYHLLNQGRCPNGTEITSKAECSEAARQLQLKETSFHHSSAPYGWAEPPNCFYHVFQNYGSLRYFKRGYGDCSNSNQCLCKGPGPTAITTTTTANGMPSTRLSIAYISLGLICGLLVVSCVVFFYTRIRKNQEAARIPMAIRLLDAVPMETDTGIRTMDTVDALMTIPPATIGGMEAIPVAVLQTVSDNAANKFGEGSQTQVMQSFQIQTGGVGLDS